MTGLLGGSRTLSAHEFLGRESWKTLMVEIHAGHMRVGHGHAWIPLTIPYIRIMVFHDSHLYIRTEKPLRIR